MHIDTPALASIANTAVAAKTAPAPTGPRFDIYAAIHKALRHYMHDTLSRLGRADVADRDDLAGALEQLDGLLTELRHHVRNENQFVHPAIEARRPGAAGRTAGDHAEHLAEIATLEGEAAALRRADAGARPALAQGLYRALAAFVAENLRHMQIEESQNNATLWALYRDDELVALHDQILASLPPAEMVTVLRWMARALSPQELATLCLDMRSKLPGELYTRLYEVIRDELDSPRRARLAQALGVAPVPGLVEVGRPEVPRGYALFDVRAVTDSDRLDRYRAGVLATVEQFGGRYLSVGGRSEAIEGQWRPRFVVLIEFPSLAHAQRWYTSPDYRELLALRLAASEGDAVLFEGSPFRR